MQCFCCGLRLHLVLLKIEAGCLADQRDKLWWAVNDVVIADREA